LALVRPPSDAFANAVSNHPNATTIDPERARRQHRGYVATLRAVGVEVVELPPVADLPDACFVEDCAVVLGHAALLCRPGVSSRAREPELVREALARHLASHIDRLDELPDGATLEGGDVLRPGSRLYSRLYVGRSRRTNPAGIDALARLAAPRIAVVPVAVPAGFLHLQTAVTALGPGTLIGVPEALAMFEPPVRGVPVTPDEHPAASVLTIGRQVIMAAGCPNAAAQVRELGYQVHEIDLSEFTKADGGPTCLSLRI
jgi:dimethylargininase